MVIKQIQGVFLAVVIGLLLLVIGVGARSTGVFLAGVFIIPVAFLWGAFFSNEQSVPMKVTFLSIAGVGLVTMMGILALLPW